MPGYFHTIIQNTFKTGKKFCLNNISFEIENVYLEYKHGHKIPDLRLDVKGFDKPVFIEVVVTHKLSEKRKNEIIYFNDFTIAINLTYEYYHGNFNWLDSDDLLEKIVKRATFVNNPYEKIQFKDGTKENYEVQYNLSLNRDDFIVITETKCCLIVCERGKIPEYEIEIVKNIAKQRPISYVRMKENDNFKNCLATKKALPLW